MTVLAAVAAVLVVGGAAVTAIRRRYLVVTVRGSSMSPAYDDADRVLMRRIRSAGVPARGEVVVLRAPGDTAKISPLLVKRVAAVPGDEVPAEFRRVVAVPVVPPGTLLVRGDNNRSADSRSFGLVNSRLVVGTAITAKKKGHRSPPDRGTSA